MQTKQNKKGEDDDGKVTSLLNHIRRGNNTGCQRGPKKKAFSPSNSTCECITCVTRFVQRTNTIHTTLIMIRSALRTYNQASTVGRYVHERFSGEMGLMSYSKNVFFPPVFQTTKERSQKPLGECLKKNSWKGQQQQQLEMYIIYIISSSSMCNNNIIMGIITSTTCTHNGVQFLWLLSFGYFILIYFFELHVHILHGARHHSCCIVFASVVSAFSYASWPDDTSDSMPKWTFISTEFPAAISPSCVFFCCCCCYVPFDITRPREMMSAFKCCRQ